MEKSPNYIVYQAYGSIDILNELIYSIASFYNQSNNLPVNIVVYTDNVKYLSKYLPSSIIYEELSTSKIKEWRGEIDFVHRVKVEMLLDFCRKYSGNVLYLDTDTIFTKSPDNLFRAISNDILVMHTSEGKMSITKNRLFEKITDFLKNKLFDLNGNSITISSEQEMWNAGVLGFTTEKNHLLYDVLALTDILHKQYKKHIMEQLSFSYIFLKNGLLTAAENQVFHYWNFKEFRQLLKEYLLEQDTFEKILATSHTINPAQLILPKIRFEKQAHLLQQFKKHVLKQKWYMPNYSQIKSQQPIL
jgi:hypothetical protein